MATEMMIKPPSGAEALSEGCTSRKKISILVVSPARKSLRIGRRKLNPTTRRTNQRFCGFTLVELLVVVAIIALLISILLPSLSKAKDLARSAVCLSHLSGAGKGFQMYAAEYDDYIPGPNTSGTKWRNWTGRPPKWDDSDSPNTPLQADDWMSPTLGNSLGLSAKRGNRLEQLFNHDFCCPANRAKYDDSWPSGAWPDATTINYNSYSSPFTFHYYFDADHAKARGNPDGAHFGNGYDRLVDIRPANHRFRLETVGIASDKIAAADGSRYINSEGKITFNVGDVAGAYGLNFTCRGATLNVFHQGNGNPYKFKDEGGGSYPALHPDVARYTYRHPNESINAVFYDGHCENLHNVESRKVKYWFPSGSVVVSTSGLGDRSVSVGDVIP